MFFHYLFSPISDLNRVIVEEGVYGNVILYVRLLPDEDRVYIPPDDSIEPNATPISNIYFPNDVDSRRNKDCFIKNWSFPFKLQNGHKYLSFSFWSVT